MLLHMADVVQKRIKKVTIRTVDTDVVVLVVVYFSNINPYELWKDISTGSSFRHIPIHQMVASIYTRQCTTFSIFHALTG